MNKEVKCPECKGKGQVPCPLEYGDDYHPDSCPVCAGNSRARVPCPDCEGSGKVNEY